MKGLMDFLENAGLVKRDLPGDVSESKNSTSAAVSPSPLPADVAILPTLSSEPASGDKITLDLDIIYTNHGVNPALYPAERLMRLVDGLSAMDQATRLMAINAMDAADESWTIADPLNDAAAKIQALAAYGSSMAQNLQQLELDTQSHKAAVTSRQEKVVGDIRKQIAELEGLVERELSRSAEEIAARVAHFQAARDQITRDLAEVAQVSQRLQSLSSQFGDPKTNL